MDRQTNHGCSLGNMYMAGELGGLNSGVRNEAMANQQNRRMSQFLLQFYTFFQYKGVNECVDVYMYCFIYFDDPKLIPLSGPTESR